MNKINQCLKDAVFFVSAILLSSLAHARPDADTKKTESENPILSVVAADWNADKRIDSAILLKSADQADLYLYLSNAAGDMELKLAKKNLVWSGALAGTLPQLKLAKDGGLLIQSENDAIGRDRWHQRLSIDYRDNDFLVTGYTYDAQDTLNPKFSLSCDVNLLTGKGVKNNKAFKIDGQKIKLSDWTDEKAPKECRN